MLIIGLTGSIGMGKSTIAARLRALGIAVCDADAVVHDLYESEAVPIVEAAFPGTTDGGKIDRGRLAAALIADPAGFERLERIVHPLVLSAQRKFLQRRYAAADRLAVLEVPLLFETGGDALVDVTMLASAPEPVQRQRVLARPGMTEEKLAEIVRRQLPDAEKRRRADFVVDTGADLEDTLAEVDRIAATLANRQGTAYSTHWA